MSLPLRTMKNKICRVCGYALSDFYATGMLGCPACYDEFRAELKPAIKDAQCGNCIHTGEPPAGGEERAMLSEYRSLIAEKERAVIERRFDDSARLSEDIFALGEELKARGLI